MFTTNLGLSLVSFITEERKMFFEKKLIQVSLRRLALRNIAKGNGGFEATFFCRNFNLLSEKSIYKFQ